ncbi:MAG: RnfABCDGE type electron transport complex subunit G [Candidatus Omnitrophota bacterium]|nr:RnfABCDGE type electron transport complex subunit G [Candidatus Omnitrophota bacterium]
MNTILKFAFILFLVNLAAASILATTYNITKPKIEEQIRMAQAEALKQVMPEEVADRIEPVEKDGVVQYWKAFKGKSSQLNGYVFIVKKYGYSSVIETMVGIKKDGTVIGLRVISQNETPGLGVKVADISFIKQFINRNVSELELSKNNINAVAGATISSRAFLDSVKSSSMEMLKNKNE